MAESGTPTASSEAGGEGAGLPGLTEVLVPARSARSLALRLGERLEIVDLEGQQVADLVAFSQDDKREWLSPSHTRGSLQSLRLGTGSVLVSNRRQPMLQVVQDDVGVHDLLFAMCDEARYRIDYGIAGHANCRDNMVGALDPWSIPSWQVPDPVNVFQNSPVDAAGVISSAVPKSRAGDRLILKALRDLIVAVSACPQDQNPCNGWSPTAILLRSYRA